jgi:hypothetical protein
MQSKIFYEHGVCWSPLWRLPYWNPTQQATVDVMHCLLEGLAQLHFRKCLVWAKNKSTSLKKTHYPAFSFPMQDLTDKEEKHWKDNEKNGIQPALNALFNSVPQTKKSDCQAEKISEHMSSLSTKLSSKHWRVLAYIATQVYPERNINTLSNVHRQQFPKAVLIEDIIKWVCFTICFGHGIYSHIYSALSTTSFCTTEGHQESVNSP